MMTPSRFLRHLINAAAALAFAGTLQAAPTLSSTTGGHAVSGAIATASVTIDFGSGYDLATLDVFVDGIDAAKLSFVPQMGLPPDLALLPLVTSNTDAISHTANYDVGAPNFVSIAGLQTFTFDFTVLSGLAENASSAFSLGFFFGDSNFGLDQVVDITLSITRDPSGRTIPEPATVLLLLGAGLAATLAQRRRRTVRPD